MTERRTIGVDLRALVGAPTGIGFFTLSLLERLARRDKAAYLGMAHASVHEAKTLAEAGVSFEYQPAPLGVLWQQLVVPRRLRRGDIDLFWSPLLTLPLGLDVPTVVTIHDLTPLIHPETHSLKVKLSMRPFIGRTVAQATRIVADSQSTADDILERYPSSRDRLRVVYPGVDPIFSPGTEDQINRTRLELGCPRGYILFVGTIEPRKNLTMLIDAWEALRQGHPDAPDLVLVGAYGWRSKKLLTRIRRLASAGGLHYLERADRNRLVRIYQAATAFVLPSLYEGFGLPAAEAMACGVPTIVTNTSSLPEVVGNAGITVDLDDRQGLIEHLSRLWKDRPWADELSRRGRERALEFDWDRTAGEMERVFAEALR